MHWKKLFRKLTFFWLVGVCVTLTQAQAQDLLPSWNDGPAKQAILDFVGSHHRPIQPEVRAP